MVAGRAAAPRRPRGRKTRDAAAQEALLAEVATLYFVDRFTQEEIARQIGRSVATVSRLLARAEASEVVEVRVHSLVPVVPALQAALVERFGLRAARVMHASASEPHMLLPRVGELAAQHITTILADGMIVVVAGSMAVREVVRAMPPGQFRDLHVVQGIGSLGSQIPNYDNPLTTRNLAERLGGTPHLLPAPMIVESPAVRDAMAQDPHFREPLQLCARADVALVGIGMADPEQSIICRAGYLDRWTMEHIRALGAVGDVMAEFYDIHGQILDTDIGSRVVGIRRDALRETKTVVAVAAGLPKAPAILGALRTGLIDVLATDDATARRVLELAERHPSPARPGRASVAARTRGATMGGNAARRDAVLAATRSLLEREGYQALTVEAVAAKAGVERQTIYRWWPSKAALALDSCVRTAAPPRATGSTREHITAILAGLTLLALPEQPGARLAHRTMIAEAQVDAEFRRAYLDWHRCRRGTLVGALAQGVADGKLAGTLDVEQTADALIGALWYCILAHDNPVDDATIRALVAPLFDACPSGRARPIPGISGTPGGASGVDPD